ncbi:TRAP transporter small permease subunit [Sulfitobacter porphyrae]|uniref:TRAP transporter small permease protein n=1 Tax=Sulfitobacter porphyrae TaxID=1246864 RepID=A0ABW2BBX1_9RHOB|nr:C4-dicarboxylate ABC transporter permease [Sulfitobacter porphyrae]
MRWFEKALKLSEAVSRLAIWIGGISVLGVTLLISAEVMLRKFFIVSTGGADEISGYVLAIGFSWALSYTALKRAHVRIDALYTRTPLQIRAYLDCLSIVSLAVFAVILSYFCLQVVLDTIELNARSNTTLGTPLWIPQVLWLMGLLLFSLTCILLSVLAVAALVRGDRMRVHELVGSRTADEELAAEMSGSFITPEDR